MGDNMKGRVVGEKMSIFITFQVLGDVLDLHVASTLLSVHCLLYNSIGALH